MDARPHRPARPLHATIVGNENIAPSNVTSQKAASNMAATATGGLKASAKRSVFGDVSNKPKTSAVDDLKGLTMNKYNTYAVKGDENAAYGTKDAHKGKDAFLRPATRAPLLAKNGPSSQPAAITASSNPKPPAGRSEPPHQPATKPAGSKKGTLVYKDPQVEVHERKVELEAEYAAGKLIDYAEDGEPPQPKSRRQQDSRPSQADKTKLHRVQSKAEVVRSEKLINFDDDVTEAAYEDAVEELLIGDEFPLYDNLEEAMTREDGKPGPLAVDLPVGGEKPSDSRYKELPAPPAMSEPEEYWDEEEVEDLYDDQGYVTAHSFRSRGDNTTGGATTVLVPRVTAKIQKELEAAKLVVEASQTEEDIEEEAWDISMVAEYGDEIFAYMRELENRMLPNPHYMDVQTEIQWSMRSVLMDWLVQVHHRFTLLPETLFLTVNYIDRFLSTKVVSIGKLQLVGATALLVASKYEEINCPSISEIVYMVDNGYSQDEILKAERFMLSMLHFELGWPGPMSFLRRISKADEYDLETRTLAKYFLEVTIMDERFVGCPPSFLAAGAHCLSRLMLSKGEWTSAHTHYSGYTFGQLKNLVALMLECCKAPRRHHAAIYEKYADRRYKRASTFVEGVIESGFRLSFSHSTGRLSLPMLDDSVSVQYPQDVKHQLLIPIEG